MAQPRPISQVIHDAVEELERQWQRGGVTYRVKHATMTPIETSAGTEFIIHIAHRDIVETILLFNDDKEIPAHVSSVDASTTSLSGYGPEADR